MPGPAFLRGDDVTLRTVEEEDLPFLQATIDDPDVRKYLVAAGLALNADQERGYYDAVVVGDDDTVNLLVCDGTEPAGTISLNDVDRSNGHAEIGLFVAPDHQGRGFGTGASRIVTAYAFEELRLHRVRARPRRQRGLHRHLGEARLRARGRPARGGVRRRRVRRRPLLRRAGRRVGRPGVAVVEGGTVGGEATDREGDGGTGAVSGWVDPGGAGRSGGGAEAV